MFGSWYQATDWAGERVEAMLFGEIKLEGLRTYLFAFFLTQYDSSISRTAMWYVRNVQE
jgi:hypothetical protein